MDYYIYKGAKLVTKPGHVFSEWEPIIPKRGMRLSLGDFDHVKNITGYKDKELYIMPDIMGGSDYSSGGPLQVSNHRVFLKRYGRRTGVYDVYGGYGSFGVAIRKDVAEKDPIKEELDSLEGYGVLDDDDESTLRDEWESQYIKENRNNLKDSIESTIEKIIPDWKWQRHYSLNKIEHLLWRVHEESRQDFSYETTGAWIDLDKIMPFMADIIIAEKSPNRSLHLLISHEWNSKEAQNIFETRLKGDSIETKDHSLQASPA